MPFLISKYDYEKQSLSKTDSVQREKEAEQYEREGTSIMPPTFSPTANDSGISKENSSYIRPRLYRHTPKNYGSSEVVNRTNRSNVNTNEPVEQIDSSNQTSSNRTRVINPWNYLVQPEEYNSKTLESGKPAKESTRPKELNNSSPINEKLTSGSNPKESTKTTNELEDASSYSKMAVGLTAPSPAIQTPKETVIEDDNQNDESSTIQRPLYFQSETKYKKTKGIQHLISRLLANLSTIPEMSVGTGTAASSSVETELTSVGSATCLDNEKSPFTEGSCEETSSPTSTPSIDSINLSGLPGGTTTTINDATNEVESASNGDGSTQINNEDYSSKSMGPTSSSKASDTIESSGNHIKNDFVNQLASLMYQIKILSGQLSYKVKQMKYLAEQMKYSTDKSIRIKIERLSEQISLLSEEIRALEIKIRKLKAKLSYSNIRGGSILSSSDSGQKGGNSLDFYIGKYESTAPSESDDAKLANIDLQNMLQKQQQTLQTMSNVSKMLHDTAMAVVRKIG